MTRERAPRLLSIPPGAPFLPTLADALAAGEQVPGFHAGGDPLALSAVTIYLPTRRAARALRSIFVDRSPGGSAILPTIRALGEFDEELALLDPTGAAALDILDTHGGIDLIVCDLDLSDMDGLDLLSEIRQRHGEDAVRVIGLSTDEDRARAAPFLRAEAHRWGVLALIATTVVLTLRTRLGLVWMVLAGGVVGALGLL